jgi:hypothetical protein
MITFDPQRAAFGRHETFPLRYGWLTKGFREWWENPGIFESEDATVQLGVGKNMVSAIRYWLIATRMVSSHGRVLEPTPLGKMLLSKDDDWDPYLEDETTLWLIHWLLASNPHEATTTFWFFNRFHKPEFTTNEVLSGLQEFVRENVTVRASASTLKHDVAVLIRMYEQTAPSRHVPLEEALDSPLATLGLVRAVPGTKEHRSIPDARSSLPVAALGYAIAELFAASRQPSLPIEGLLHGDGRIAAPGSVFRLTGEGLITKLEQLVQWLPRHFELRETAGIHQIYRLQPIDPLELLSWHYIHYVAKEAA